MKPNIRDRCSAISAVVKAQPTNFWIAQCIFLGTGLTNNILASQLSYMGAANIKNGLEVTSLYVGQFLSCLFFPSEWRTIQWGWLRHLWWMMILDIGCATCYFVALLNIGSGMATVLYSAIVVFSGLLQRLIYKKSMTWARWVAVVLIPVFVSFSAIEQVRDNTESSAKQTLGCILILASALGYALLFVLENKILDMTATDSTTEDNDSRGLKKPSATHMAIFFSLNAIPCIIFIAGYVAPQWSSLMFNDNDNISNWGYGVTKWTIIFYIFFIVSNGAHQQAFFFCVSDGPVAAVSSGVNKALQAAFTFLVSDLVFCRSQHDQCLTPVKAVGMIGISFFVFWYSCIDLALGQNSSSPAPVDPLSTPSPPGRSIAEPLILPAQEGQQSLC